MVKTSKDQVHLLADLGKHWVCILLYFVDCTDLLVDYLDLFVDHLNLFFDHLNFFLIILTCLLNDCWLDYTNITLKLIHKIPPRLIYS